MKNNNMPRTKKATKEQVNVLTVAADVGFGFTKAMTAEIIIEPFSSVYGPAHEVKFSNTNAENYPGEQIWDDEGLWWVGNRAEKHVPHGQLFTLRGRTADNEATGNAFRLRMLRVALGKLLAGAANGDVYQIRLATGLPVDHMDDADTLKKALLGRHHVQTDAADFVADIVEVFVIPQPYGGMYSQTLTVEGEINRAYKFHVTGVVDVGTYTIDLSLDDNGEYIDSKSGSAESGVYTARSRISTVLEREMRQKPSNAKIEEVLIKGGTTIQGKWRNFEIVDEALEPLRRATLNLMQAKWESGADIDNILLIGGGGPLVEQVVKKQYSQSSLILNPQLAVIQGYMNYALWATQSQSN